MYMRGESNFDYWMIAGKSADFMLQVFSEIVKNLKRTHVVSIVEVDQKIIVTNFSFHIKTLY